MNVLLDSNSKKNLQQTQKQKNEKRRQHPSITDGKHLWIISKRNESKTILDVFRCNLLFVWYMKPIRKSNDVVQTKPKFQAFVFTESPLV